VSERETGELAISGWWTAFTYSRGGLADGAVALLCRGSLSSHGASMIIVRIGTNAPTLTPAFSVVWGVRRAQ
jgi:hypothetical protein